MFCLRYFLLVGLGSVAYGQNFSDSSQWLKLVGPDDENMLTCSVTIALPLDTNIEWYLDGQLVKTVFFPHGHQEQYESLEELIDLLGNYPKTVECVIDDTVINTLPGVSNKITIQ